MSSFGELIQALGALKNVKEKRHGIKTLSSLCANRAFQVRIVNKGGWQNAILPLIISLDEECRKYASLAIANLSTSTQTHEKLLEEQVLRHLVPILQSEEVTEVVVYVLNALGNFACSEIMWPQLRLMNTMETVVNILKSAAREEIKVNGLFFLANLSADEQTRQHMIEISLHETVWEHMRHPNYLVMQYALAMLRGLSVEAPIQDTLPRLGIMPLLVSVFKSQSPQVLKIMVLDIILHLSFLHSNSMLLLDRTVVECIVGAARSSASPEFVTTAVAIIANLCENVELHDRLMETDLFPALSEHVDHDSYSIQQHVIRGLMQLSLSPKYHHVILSTNVVAKVCMIAVGDLPDDMRVNALELMAAVCATHPTVPTESDVVDLLYLICNEGKHIDIRRAAMLTLANASSDVRNSNNLLKRPYVEALLISLSKATDVMLVDYMTQFFHNICKMDPKTGSMLIQCGYGHHMFTFERLEALSITSAVYVCDTCRHLVDDAVVRAHLLERMMFQTMLDAWAVYIEEPHIAPHLALMCSAFAFHADTHREFVMQHGVRLVIELYSRSEVEHVRLCCLLTLLYLADGPFAQRAIGQERGLQMLLNSCESETHIDLITNSLKALIPFASSDDYRPQLGMDGGIDTFSSFLFSPHLPLQQLGVYLLQNLLEISLNRRIFLNIAEERKTEEDYLEPLVRFLPSIKAGRGSQKKKASPKAKRGKAKGLKQGQELTAHDPFVVRCTIHSIALLCLENHDEVRQRFMELQIPQTLYTLLYSEQIDRSSGEAIMLFFANLLHSSKYVQAGLLRQLELVPMLLSSNEMGFSRHTDIRCLSALLSIARVPEFKQRVLGQLELIMTSVNANISVTERDESFYSTAALHCVLLSELAMSAPEIHEKMRNAGVMEAFLIFITIAGRGLRDEICVELLMSAVFGIATLTASATCGEAFINSLLFPATRLQLFVSLLRLPADDINTTFHLGTVGLRTLQRTAAPGLRAEELHIDNLDTMEFFDMCGIRPSDFIYRNVVRTLCVILARPELARTVIESISLQNVVPTCLFALRGTSDIYVQVLGYMLVGRFTTDSKLQNAFVNDSSVINEILTVCRRHSPGSDDAAGPKESEAFKLAAFGKGAGQWSVQSVNRNRYLLAMVTLANLAERVKEKYRNQEIKAGTPEAAGQLSYSNHAYLGRLTATCLQQMDAEELMEGNRGIEEVQEFMALLRVIVVHNSFMGRIELESQQKGGLVKIADIPEQYGRAVRAGQELVLPELRAEFKSLYQVQAKSEGLLNVVQKCLEMECGTQLIGAAVECLCALTYLGPMSIRDPSMGYRLLQNCPTWIQPSLCCLFANTLSDFARPGGDLDYLTEEESSHLYPLAATSPQETQRYIRGALANVAARNELFDFVLQSGVLRVYRRIETRGHFCEDFLVIIESVRILANLVSRSGTHKEVCTEHVIAFLRDVLHHCVTLLKGDLGNARAMPPEEEFITATFSPDDEPPLGIRLKWEQPPKIVEIIPDKPAAFLEEPLEVDDQLIEVNGVDVQEMIQEEIQHMFEARPLRLVFRRLIKADAAAEEDSEEEPVVQQIHSVTEYGDRDLYLECFHLAILTLHNLAAVKTNHQKMLAEPRILNTLLELIPSEVLLPTLRRLVFSLLTCLCQQKAISGRIFTAMSEYFMDQDAADVSLQKYIVLSANLYYTSIDQVIPDRAMLIFVGKLASMEGMAGANQALVEILHRMAMGPKELRAPFVCHETMVLTVQFVDLIDYPEVQLQAFEVAYFLTISNLIHNLWASTDVCIRVVKSAASAEHKTKLYGTKKHKEFEDALWELALRILSMCLGNNILLKQMLLSELDRYLMKLFMSEEDHPIQLLECAGHLMAGLLQTGLAGTFWNRWKSMGVADKFIAWFGSCKSELSSKERDTSTQEVGQGVDSVLHLLLFALDCDPTFLTTIGAGDVVSCITLRILHQVSFYQRNFSTDDQADDSELIVPTNSAYRANAQLVSLLTANDKALDIMNQMELASPLVSLLKLRSEDFREPTLVILSSLCAHKTTCNSMMHNNDFRGILKKLEQNMENPKFALPHEELEYLVCILDRSCCHATTAAQVQHSYLHLLCLLMLKTESIDSQVLALRSITQCAFERAECLEDLAGKDMESLHYIMALNECLHFEMKAEDDEEASEEEDEGMAAVARRNMLAKIHERNTNYPCEARLVRHFARTILCEAVSISRSVCQSAFLELDIIALLGDMTNTFHHAYQRIDDHDDRADTVTNHLMNSLNSMLHIILSVIFRGGGFILDDQEPNPKTRQAQHKVTDALVTVLDAVHAWLRLDEMQYRSDNTPSVVASKFAEDMRPLFLLSALLREVCAKPARHIFLRVVRSRKFSEVLQGTIRLTYKVFKRTFNFPDAGRPKEERNSPFTKHIVGIRLPFIFEHLLVCMRHMLAQSMYIPTPVVDVAGEGEGSSEPWCWVSQDQLDIHKTSVEWIPDVLKRYREEPGITMEVVRYVSAVATFYVAPQASVDESAPSRPLCDLYGLFGIRILQMLTAILETEEDPCTVSLATLAVANLAECERQSRLMKGTKTKLPVADLLGMVNALIRVISCVPSYPREMALICTIHVLRAPINFFALEDIAFTFNMLTSGYMQAVKDIFKEWFRDVFKIQSVQDYTLVLQLIIQFIRNWTTVGNMVDRHFEEDRKSKGVHLTKMDYKRAEEISEQLQTKDIMNFLVNAVFKLVDAGREVPDKDNVLDGVFEEAITTMQTLLFRDSKVGSLDWEHIAQDDLERLLQCMLEHRFARSGVYEDPPMIQILFMMTKLGVRYQRVLFPDYLMKVAYGPRDHHTEMQDIAAVCCAIISTQRKGQSDSSASCNIADVVENCADFIRSLSEVPDRRMRLWHFRTITLWSQRPKVLDEVSESETAVRYLASLLSDDLMGRYTVIFLHNVSVLRSKSLLKATGLIAVICKSYRSYCKGGDFVAATPEHEGQRRMLQHVQLAMVRNCLLGSYDLNNELADEDFTAIVQLADCVAQTDIGLYLATLLYTCHDLPPERVAKFLPTHGPLVDLLLKLVFDRENVPKGGYSGPDDLYNCVADPLKSTDEEEKDEEPEATSPVASPQMSRAAKSPSRRDASPKSLGLGKKASLYQQMRRPKQATAGKQALQNQPPTESKKKKEGERRYQESVSEFVYFAAAEILTHSTFRKDDPLAAEPAEKDAPPDATREAIDAAFARHSVTAWLRFLENQAVLHDGKKVVLSNLFVHVSAKFLLHCWSNVWFVKHFDTPVNIKLVSELVPFFLDWRMEDVHPLLAEVCLRARLHQYPPVCEYLGKEEMRFPELACTVLSHALVDTACPLSTRQAFVFFKVFVELLRRRAITRNGLRRLAVSVEMSLLIDHPAGLAGQLMQKQHRLLADLLEQFGSYIESGTVKQAMVVITALTVGPFYKPLQELDGFVLRMLDMAGPLLEDEFVLFMPVLHRLAQQGGKRVQGPILSKHLHMRIARILEDDVSQLEGALRAKERVTADDGPNLNLCQRIQWQLVFFATLGAAEGNKDGNVATGAADNLHFDAFVCVDLMPVLVRILKAAPQNLEALCAGFLLSSVAGSPCIVPHMPAILNTAERAFPQVIESDAIASATEKKLEFIDEPKWPHLHLAIEVRITMAMRRNLINLLANASYQPALKPPLLGDSKSTFNFFSGLDCERYTFDNPTVPLYVKLFCIAQMCSCPDRDVQNSLLEHNVLDALGEAEVQLEGEFIPDGKNHPCDMRLLWVHAVVSLTMFTGSKLLKIDQGVERVLSAMRMSEALLRENKGFSSKSHGLVLECMQALSYAVGRLSKSEEFAGVRENYTLYLLAIICSAPINALRLAACEHLIDMVSKGYRSDICGSVLLKTICIQSFKEIICGPLDDLASGVTRVMIAFVQNCTYDVYCTLLENLAAIEAMIGDPNANPTRVLWLAELFAALTKERTLEVFDAVLELPSIVSFLSLARAQQARKRELVQHWLENLGSSLYEVDEVISAFQTSTYHGYLLIASRCTLDPKDAKELRRILFGAIYKRVSKWRETVFGINEFLSASLIKAMLPMCDLQPDLVAAMITLFHSFMTHGEHQMVERIWESGHFLWICKRLAHKSEAQKAIMQAAPNAPPTVARMRGMWPSHGDLVVTQGMVARLLWEFFQIFPVDVCDRTVNTGGSVKTWQEYVTYYIHFPWPEDSKDVAQATESVILLFMRFFDSVHKSVDENMQQNLVGQGLLGLCLTILLPSPEVQKSMAEDLQNGEAFPEFSDDLHLPEAKMMAGAMAARMTYLIDTYKCVQDRRYLHQSIAMFAQLYNWGQILMDFDKQGRAKVISTVGLPERISTLFLNLLSVTHLDWQLPNLGLGKLEALVGLMLNIWCLHPNVVMQHYALRLFGTFVQVKELYAAALADEERAVAVKNSIHRMFGIWDVRELRQVLRLMCAALGHSLDVPVLPSHVTAAVKKAMTLETAQRLRKIIQEGGFVAATQGAAGNILLISYLNQVLQRSEQPGDVYCRVWSLWLVLVMLRHSGTHPFPVVESSNPDQMLVFYADGPDKEKLARRARLLAEQEKVAAKKSDSVTGPSVAFGSENLTPTCRIPWLKDSPQLNICLARMTGKSIATMWREAETIGLVAAALLLIEFPFFLDTAAFTIEGNSVLHCLTQPEKGVQLNTLLLTAILSSFRLPLRAQTLSADFLKHFYDLQEIVIEGVVGAGEGPYDLLATWLRRGLYGSGTPVEADFRCLIAHIIGQGLCPPLATVPSLNVDTAERPERAPGGKAGRVGDDEEIPTVAECPPPPEALLGRLSQEILDEDLRLRQSQVPPPRNEGPLFSTLLCHLLYALASMVPLHPKAAAFSSKVRGAAFSQLMKVQNIVAMNIRAPQLLDSADGERAKLYLYVRATACIRAALQSIMGSWFAADFGARFSISEEGGQDFVQYCTKHIIQVYNNKIALTRVLGSPWQRVMLTQGPTSTIAELLLVLCSSDSNLQEVGRLGGQQALHALSKYGETVQTRQQATMLLTKLAVLDAPPGR